MNIIWGGICDEIPCSIEYSKPEAHFPRVRPCTSSAKQYQTWPKRLLKWSKTIPELPQNHAWSNGQHVCPNICPPSFPIPAVFAIFTDLWPFRAPPGFSQRLPSPVILTSAALVLTSATCVDLFLPLPQSPFKTKTKIPGPKSWCRAISYCSIIQCKNNYPTSKSGVGYKLTANNPYPKSPR